MPKLIAVSALGCLLCTFAAAGERSIQSISVCGSQGPGAVPSSCPPGTFDTQEIVVANDGSGNTINDVAGGAITDEHATVFPPGSLGGNDDYIFFVASGTHNGNPDVGVIVLSGGTGPGPNGQWSMGFASQYGNYAGYGYGAVFLAPVRQGHCPTMVNGVAITSPSQQDATFDIEYAAAGSVVRDPTARPGSLLMFYEGANICFGSLGGAHLSNGGGSAYITTGAATSLDFGRSWPTYASTPTFTAAPLPYGAPYPDSTVIPGPDAPNGATGAGVCQGNDCSQPLPPSYGRYPILAPPLSLAGFMQTGLPLVTATGDAVKMGDAEPSAFVDEYAPGPDTYVYVLHGYAPGGVNGVPGGPPLGAQTSVLSIARARLNGGAQPLQFAKWNGSHYAEPGVGGIEAPIFPAVTTGGPSTACEAANQGMHSASISYVEDTQQYLLVFVCDSNGDPNGPGTGVGSSWFYSTSRNLSDPGSWSVPQEVSGSWSSWAASCASPPAGPGPGQCSGAAYKGWYPTLMSLHHASGRLTTAGFVFYLWGCQGGCEAKRQYSTRQFTMTLTPPVGGRRDDGQSPDEDDDDE